MYKFVFVTVALCVSLYPSDLSKVNGVTFLAIYLLKMVPGQISWPASLCIRWGSS